MMRIGEYNPHPFPRREKRAHGPTVEYGRRHDGVSSAEDLKKADDALQKLWRERPMKPPGRAR